MRRFCFSLMFSGVFALHAEEAAPLAAWEDAGNPSMLTNAFALPTAFTAMGWFEAGSFADLAPVLSYTEDLASGTNGFGVFATAEGSIAAFVRSRDDENVLVADGVATNAPYHFALSYSGSDAVLYLNGFPVAATNFAAAQSLDWGGELWAGLPAGEASVPAFDGAFADVRLYGTALAWRDVASVFVAGSHEALAADGVDVLHLDADADGMPDVWEMDNGFNPLDPADAAEDSDGDGMDNLGEYRRGRNPRAGVSAASSCLIHSVTELSP